MSSKNERLDITMRLLGARQVERESEKAGKGIKGVGTAARSSAGHHEKIHRATSTLTKSYSQLGKATRYGMGFLGAGGVLALKSSITGTEELAKTTSGLNRNMGLSVKTGSEWASLAHARGIEASTLTMGMTKLGKSFVEANRKGGTARTALNQLGITQTQTTKGAHDFNFAVDLVAGALGRAHGGAQRQTAALGVLGKGSRELIPIFSEGREGLEKQLHWADKYGSTLNGKSLEGVMAMVTAQREFKASMFGLQVQATTALLPAIHAVDDEVNTLASTLANPKLTEEQKFSRISHQFLNLENDLLGILEKALPKIAEKGGELGVRLAEAVWTGFKNSNIVGKLVISAWLFKFMGGFSLIGSLGARIGGKLATSLGTRFLETVAPYFAAQVGVEGLGSAMAARMPGLTTLFGGFGTALGGAFATAFVAAAGFSIGYFIGTLLAKHMDAIEETLLGKQFGGLGPGQAEEGSRLGRSNKELHELGMNNAQIHAQRRSEHWWEKHHPKESKERHHAPGTHRGDIKPQHSPAEKHHAKGGRRGNLMATGGQPFVVHNHIHLDGKEVAENVLEHGLEAAALR